jgi:hypothetical protein
MPFSKNIIVGTIYRPPNKKVEVFENAMNVLLLKIDKENKICYLMGDFNIDLLKSESCDYANRFIEQPFTSSFVPLITKPTRITEHTATIIDIFTNNIEKVENSINGIIFTDISDHLPILHMFDSKNPVENSTKQTNVIYKREINNSNITIKNASWDNVFFQENPTKSFNEFSKIFTTTYETNFPLRQKHLKNNIDQGKSPWMTRCIIKSEMKKNKLYKTFLRNPSEKNKTKYKKYKNKLNHIIKMAKKNIMKNS